MPDSLYIKLQDFLYEAWVCLVYLVTECWELLLLIVLIGIIYKFRVPIFHFLFDIFIFAYIIAMFVLIINPEALQIYFSYFNIYWTEQLGWAACISLGIAYCAGLTLLLSFRRSFRSSGDNHTEQVNIQIHCSQSSQVTCD